MESLKFTGSAFLVIIPFVLLFSLVFKELQRQKRKSAALHEVDRRLKELKRTILVVSTPTIPGKKIEQDLGEVTAETALFGSPYSIAEKKALIALLEKALEKGASAIVKVHRKRLSYEAAKKIPLRKRTICLIGKAVKTAT